MAETKKVDIVIAGGGLAGLNVGIEALSKGYRNVTVLEASLPDPELSANPGKQRISSSASTAGLAQFYPYIEGGLPTNQEREIVKWIEDALDSWTEREAVGRYKSTMARRRKVDFMRQEHAEPMPDYLREILRTFGDIKEFGGIPQNPLALTYGYDFTTLAFNSPAVMQAMREEFEELGGNILVRKIQSAEEFYSLSADVLVDCLGLGAQDIFPELGLEPVKGNLLFYKNPGIDTIVSGYDLVVFPRSADILAVGVGYIHEFDTKEPTKKETDYILDGVNKMISIDIEQLRGLHERLTQAEFIGETAGFRPYRKAGTLIAAEAGPKGQVVIHNVGHGGMGWTLAGTGKAAVRLIKEVSS